MIKLIVIYDNNKEKIEAERIIHNNATDFEHINICLESPKCGFIIKPVRGLGKKELRNWNKLFSKTSIMHKEGEIRERDK